MTPTQLIPDVPAIFGGRSLFQTPLRFIQPTLPNLQRVLRRYESVYASGVITNADLVGRFESAVAQMLGVRHCVAVSSCTSGLALAMRAMDLKGDVILPSFTFFATGHAIRWNNLTPVFADCNPETWNIQPSSVEAAITNRTSAIVAVHLYGNPCPVEALEKIAADHKLKLIYDAAHGFGSLHQGRHVGQFGDCEVFSLSPTKLLVAGEGGLVTTDDATLAHRLRAARNYGDLGAYDPEVLGLNARMSEFNAALGLAGLEDVQRKAAHHNEIADLYTHILSTVPGLGFQKVLDGDTSTYKDYSVCVEPDVCGFTRDQLAEALAAEMIPTKKYFYPPLHKQTIYRPFAPKSRQALRHTNRITGTVLSLPVYDSLDDETVKTIAYAVQRYARHASSQRAAAGGVS